MLPRTLGYEKRGNCKPATASELQRYASFARMIVVYDTTENVLNPPPPSLCPPDFVLSLRMR